MSQAIHDGICGKCLEEKTGFIAMIKAILSKYFSNSGIYIAQALHTHKTR
jgi:hypothetical protein